MTKTNNKKLGDYIKKVNVRNTENLELPLMGLTIDKKFIPSVANTIGTDLTKYKVVYKNQFACSLMQVSRDGKMPIARLDEEAVIMSPAYPIFKVTKPEILLPEYLEMWFKREEFDREAAFYAVGGVRGNLTWEDFCDMTLPIPSIEKQRKIVADYQAVENKIKTNEAICDKLEETAQTIYRRWFEEFEFLNEEGKPYKSNGGEMVWNEELEKEVPKGWEVKKLEEIASIKHGYAFKGKYFSEEETNLVLISPGNFNIGGGFSFSKNKFYNGELVKDYVLKKNDFIINMTDLSKAGDTLGNTAIIPKIKFKVLQHNQRVGLFNLKNDKYLNYLYFLTQTPEYKYYILGTATGTTVRHTSPKRIVNYTIIKPPENYLLSFNRLINPIINQINLKYSTEYFLHQLQSLLLGRMTREEELCTKEKII